MRTITLPDEISEELIEDLHRLMNAWDNTLNESVCQFCFQADYESGDIEHRQNCPGITLLNALLTPVKE
jgi:hypothetical protein